jgi:hypothetical protein
MKLKLQGSGVKKSCIKKFLFYFPKGFYDPKYTAWERGYKWDAHIAWEENLNKKEYAELLRKNDFLEIARRATRLESKTNLLFSFEKMALRDAVKTHNGAKLFSESLFNFIYGRQELEKRFIAFIEATGQLPRKQTRVLTWPLVTVFGFIAEPAENIFLKPKVTKLAAEKYGYSFKYQSKPNWATYADLLQFAQEIKKDIKDLRPRDMIDIQSFIWVLGSEEYPD